MSLFLVVRLWSTIFNLIISNLMVQLDRWFLSIKFTMVYLYTTQPYTSLSFIIYRKRSSEISLDCSKYLEEVFEKKSYYFGVIKFEGYHVISYEDFYCIPFCATHNVEYTLWKKNKHAYYMLTRHEISRETKKNMDWLSFVLFVT